MKKVCILAKEGSQFAQFILSELENSSVDCDVIWIRKKKRESKFAQRLLIPYNLYKSLSTGRFKALPKGHWWTWKLFFTMKKQSSFSPGMKFPEQCKRDVSQDFYVPSVNHVKTFDILSKGNYQIGILGGVDIVNELIIDQFKTVCLNAHPAPLPECRGGGALENTLYQGLEPACSVHEVTAKIDEGVIYGVEKIDLHPRDTFKSIYVKLNLQGAKMLADLTTQFLQGENVKGTQNQGKLYFWKDWNLAAQRKAHENLAKLLSDLKSSSK